MPVSTSGSAKKTLREELASLEPATESTRAMVIEQVDSWLQGRPGTTVVGFLAMGDEIDIAPLVGRRPDIRWALTRTAPGMELTVHPFDAPREMHRYGFAQPAADAESIPRNEVDVVLVPGLAFARDGRRLGRGAGYYDRFLASVDAEAVALTVEARIRSDIPVEPHDQLVDWIATEAGVVRSGR